MKRKNVKQVIAAVMSAALVMGMPMAAWAAEGDENDNNPAATEIKAEVEAPIYSFDVTNVVVPTSLVVAFNPDKLVVKTGGTNTSQAQVLSKNFGMLNKSNKDKIVTVTLKVQDLNDGKITFVDSDADATGAAEGEYAVHLAVVPADATEVKVGDTPASADKDTAGAAMASVDMTAATAQAVTLEAGDNAIAFVLGKGTYTAVSGSELELGGSGMNGNNVGNNLELTSVAADGKGITAFTFTGALNEKADWSKLDKGIKITAVYDFETTYEYDELTDADNGSIVSGTGAMLDGVAPKFTTGGVGVINFTAGTGDKTFASLVSVKAPWDGAPFDITSYATAEAGTITIGSGILGGWAEKGENPTATIVYKNAADDEVEATVTLKTHE